MVDRRGQSLVCTTALVCRKNDRPTFDKIDKLLSRITYIDDDDVEMTSDPPPDLLNVDSTHPKLMA